MIAFTTTIQHHTPKRVSVQCVWCQDADRSRCRECFGSGTMMTWDLPEAEVDARYATALFDVIGFKPGAYAGVIPPDAIPGVRRSIIRARSVVKRIASLCDRHGLDRDDAGRWFQQFEDVLMYAQQHGESVFWM